MTATVEQTLWWHAAACLNVDPDLFHPAKGESAAPAKAVCAGCEVRLACLDWALSNHEKFGIWGGFSERERRQIGYAPIAERTRTCTCCGATYRPARRDRDQPFCTPDCRKFHITRCLKIAGHVQVDRLIWPVFLLMAIVLGLRLLGMAL